VDTRELLERLEAEGGDATAALAWVAVQGVDLDAEELAAARRRALLVLASGGDPRRDLEPDSRAVSGRQGSSGVRRTTPESSSRAASTSSMVRRSVFTRRSSHLAGRPAHATGGGLRTCTEQPGGLAPRIVPCTRSY